LAKKEEPKKTPPGKECLCEKDQKLENRGTRENGTTHQTANKTFLGRGAQNLIMCCL
jgi:hypothetical protein